MNPQSDFYIGIMSGTSLDGVDAVLAHIVDGGRFVQLLARQSCTFPTALRDELLVLQSATENELQRAYLAGIELSKIYARLVAALLEAEALTRADVAAIGVHGQTVRHCPELGFTVQLNQPALLAELTGITVVADFRSRDIAAGGQGAPLVPAFHAQVFASPDKNHVILNMGGIANITYVPRQAAVHDVTVYGFDTGPANVLMDGWMYQHQGLLFDQDGAWAAQGLVNQTLLAELLNEAYFHLPAPKSTGRDLFNMSWLAAMLQKFPEISAVDVQATLLELTAQSITKAILDLPHVDEVYACGGGALNRHLMARLNVLLAPRMLNTTDNLGVPVMDVEALAFAWLAARCMQSLPGNLPAVTGAAGKRILGAIYPA